MEGGLRDTARKAALGVLASPLILLGAIAAVVAVVLDKLFPVTWLDRRLARKHYERLSAEVQSKLPFLFTECGGRVVPNDCEYPIVFDYAVVTVAVGKLRFRFVRGRDEFRVDVAPEHAPTAWEEVGTLLQAIAEPGEFRRRPEYFRFQDFGRLLKPRLERMAAALSPEQSGATGQELAEIHERDEAKMRRLENELNRRLR